MRQSLGLDSSATDYQSIRDLVGRLVAFRDSFAHPKEHTEAVAGAVDSELAPMPAIAWQSEVRSEAVRADFERVESYCEMLLEAASEALKKAYDQGWTVWRQKYAGLRKSSSFQA